jgi:Lrp/AsnC family transcriptional regulator for asnA, asnC and gidA
MKLDEIDLRILELLRKDARITFTKIGDALGVADSTVHIRVKKMVDGGVIKSFTINVNSEALGRVGGLLMLDVVPGCFEEVLPNLIQSENVQEILELHGPYVALLKISARNLDEMRDEIIRIRKIPHVTRTEMIPILKTWKKI